MRTAVPFACGLRSHDREVFEQCLSKGGERQVQQMEEEGKCAILWMLGEYGENVDDAPSRSRSVVPSPESSKAMIIPALFHPTPRAPVIV